MEPCCTVCGDPATGTCHRLIVEAVVIPLKDLAAGDLLLKPSGPFVVKEVRTDKDELMVETTRKRLLMLYPELPVLVRREVICGWPCCDLHCGKCARRAEEEWRRRELLQLNGRVKKPHGRKRRGASIKNRLKPRTEGWKILDY